MSVTLTIICPKCRDSQEINPSEISPHNYPICAVCNVPMTPSHVISMDATDHAHQPISTPDGIIAICRKCGKNWLDW